jgi:hypothetical protein
MKRSAVALLVVVGLASVLWGEGYRYPAESTANMYGTSFTDEVGADILAVTVPDDSICSLTVSYHAWYTSATEVGGQDGIVTLLAYEEPGAAATYVCDVDKETENILASDAGTFTSAWSCTNAASTILTITLDQETSDLSGHITWKILMSSGCIVTPL